MWYYVYILELSNGQHYVGCAINLKERMAVIQKDTLPQRSHIFRLSWCGVVLFLTGVKLMHLKNTLNQGQEEPLQRNIYYNSFT